PALAPLPYTTLFRSVPPSAEAVAASARGSRLLTMVDGLVGWLGATGRPVTGTGAFKLADARGLVELMRTGDRVDSAVQLRSSREDRKSTRLNSSHVK